jgi:hypothetical protein
MCRRCSLRSHSSHQMSRSGFAGRREAYYAPVRSVVTGGAGSIGSNLVHAPLDEGRRGSRRRQPVLGLRGQPEHGRRAPFVRCTSACTGCPRRPCASAPSTAVRGPRREAGVIAIFSACFRDGNAPTISGAGPPTRDDLTVGDRGARLTPAGAEATEVPSAGREAGDKRARRRTAAQRVRRRKGAGTALHAGAAGRGEPLRLTQPCAGDARIETDNRHRRRTAPHP